MKHVLQRFQQRDRSERFGQVGSVRHPQVDGQVRPVQVHFQARSGRKSGKSSSCVREIVAAATGDRSRSDLWFTALIRVRMLGIEASPKAVLKHTHSKHSASCRGGGVKVISSIGGASATRP